MANLFTRVFQFFGLPRKAQQPVAAGSYGIGVEQLLEHALYGSLTVSPSTAFSLYRQSSAIATAVDLIASKIESITPVIERNGEIQERDEVTEFLAKPNDFSMWRSFIGKAARHTLLTGDCYFLGLGTLSRPPLEIYNAHPVEIAPVSIVSDGFPDVYNFSGMLAPGSYRREPRPGGGVRFVDGPLREIYHHKGFSTRTQHLTGDSPIESILLEIRQHIAGRQHNESMLRQGGRLSLLFLIKESLPDPIFRGLAARNREQFSGPSNAGKVATIAAKDLDIKEFGVSNKDMDYVNLDEITKAAIFSRYNIPLPLIAASRQTFSTRRRPMLR